jgi:hypothetical protein
MVLGHENMGSAKAGTNHSTQAHSRSKNNWFKTSSNLQGQKQHVAHH